MEAGGTSSTAVALASLPAAPASYHSSAISSRRPPPPPPAAVRSSPSRVRSRTGFTRPFAALQIAAWVLMSVCVILYFSLCVPFVPAGHDAEFYCFVFIYIGIFLPGFAAYIASVPPGAH